MPETVNDKILDETLSQQIRIERLAENQRRRINRLLLALVADIESLTRRADRDPTNVRRISAQRARLDRLIEEIDELLDEQLLGPDGIHDDLANNILNTVVPELNSTIGIINAAIGADLLRQSISRDHIETLITNKVFPSPSDTNNPNVFRGESRSWMINIRDSFSRRLRSAWLGSLTDGPSLNDLLIRLRGSRAGRLGDRTVSSLTSAQIQAMYRTWQSAVHNQARIDLYSANSDFLKSIRDVATFDDRTVRISIARHGNRYRLPDLRPMRRLDGGQSHAYLGGMPYHVGERNFYTPETRRISEIEASDRDHIKRRVRELNESQREALNGSIPSNTTFDGFLNRQTVARQREILGDGTYRLWRDGRLNLRDLIRSSTGRQLTVAELQAQYGSETASNLR